MRGCAQQDACRCRLLRTRAGCLALHRIPTAKLAGLRAVPRNVAQRDPCALLRTRGAADLLALAPAVQQGPGLQPAGAGQAVPSRPAAAGGALSGGPGGTGTDEHPRVGHEPRACAHCTRADVSVAVATAAAQGPNALVLAPGTTGPRSWRLTFKQSALPPALVVRMGTQLTSCRQPCTVSCSACASAQRAMLRHPSPVPQQGQRDRQAYLPDELAGAQRAPLLLRAQRGGQRNCSWLAASPAPGPAHRCPVCGQAKAAAPGPVAAAVA